MFQKVGIKAKLISAFIAVALVAVVVGGVSSYYSSNAVSAFRNIAKNNVPNLKLYIDMKAVITHMIVPPASLIATNSTPEDAAKAKAELDKDVAEFDKLAKAYEEAPFAPGEEQFWKSFKNEHYKKFLESASEMIRLSGTNNKADQKLRDQMWDGEFAERIKEVRAGFDSLSKFQLEDTERNEKMGDELTDRMNWIIRAAVVLGFSFALFLGFVISSALSKELSGVAAILAQGSEEVSSAVTQLSAAAEELSTASNQQAASVQETAASVDEISAMVQKNAQSALESSKVSDISKNKAETGKVAVDRMVQSMGSINRSNQEIQSQIEKSNQRIGEIIQVIQEIGSKTKVINDIVFQTKLLSFNASVEAARAGEHGKGFAVVAEEVGNLAQMSGASAKEISSLLEDSVRKVEEVVNESKQAIEGLMVQARQTVEHGGETATECGHTLEEIVRNVQNLSEMVAGISSASKEQSNGVEEISKAVREIDQATQANASAAQQTSSSAHQLSLQVNTLKQASDRLRNLVEGGKGMGADFQPTHSTAPAKKSNVVALKRKAAQAARPANGAPAQELRRASGSDLLPSESDTRFSEV